MASLFDDIKQKATAAAVAVKSTWNRLRTTGKIITVFASAWTALDAAYVFVYHTVELRGQSLYLQIENLRLGLTYFLQNGIRHIATLLSSIAALPYISEAAAGIADAATRLLSNISWLLSYSSYLSAIFNALVTYATAGVQINYRILTTLDFPVAYYGAWALLFSWALLEFRSNEDDTLLDLVQETAASPNEARPTKNTIDVNEDPIADAIEVTPLSPYGLGVRINEARAMIGAGLNGLANAMARLRHWVASLSTVYMVIAFPLTTITPLFEAFVRFLALAVRTGLKMIHLFDAQILRRILQRPRFLLALQNGNPTLGSALEDSAYGAHYYEVTRLMPRELTLLSEHLETAQNDPFWPIINVRHDRHAPAFVSELLYHVVTPPRRYAQRFLFFRLEETICLDPLGPQFLLFAGSNIAGAGTQDDPFEGKWKNIRPRYAKVTVRLNANVYASPWRVYWVWSSPIVVAASRLSRLATVAGVSWTAEDAAFLIAALVDFQRTLLESRGRELDARPVLNVRDVEIRVALWWNREGAKDSFISLDYWTKLVDRLRIRLQRRGQAVPLDLTADRAVLDATMRRREPTKFYPIQLDLHTLRINRVNMPPAIAGSLRFILFDYMCRLADTFSWIILMREDAAAPFIEDLRDAVRIYYPSRNGERIRLLADDREITLDDIKKDNSLWIRAPDDNEKERREQPTQ